VSAAVGRIRLVSHIRHLQLHQLQFNSHAETNEQVDEISSVGDLLSANVGTAVAGMETHLENPR
jgi:hypothetical protein